MDLTAFSEGLRAMSPYEIAGTIFGALGVWLAVKQKALTWPVSMVSVALYTYIFYIEKLYADMGLQVFYLATSAYGWYIWLYGGKHQTKLPVSRTNLQEGMLLFVLAILLAVMLGYFLQSNTNADLPYADSALAAGSLAAYWLMARKRLENWLLWVLIDTLYIWLYLHKELYVTAVLYGLFTLMAARGFFLWRKELKAQAYA